MTDTIRTFRLNRKEDASGVSGTGIVAVGALFPSGRCVIEWLPGRVDVRSFNIYQSLDEIKLVNGHDGKTVIEFDDEQCGCGLRNCTRHRKPSAPDWKLYHPITSRLEDALVDLSAARAAGNVGTNKTMAIDLIGQMEFMLAQLRSRFAPPATDGRTMMLEVGVEGDQFNPHPVNAACVTVGCVPQ